MERPILLDRFHGRLVALLLEVVGVQEARHSHWCRSSTPTTSNCSDGTFHTSLDADGLGGGGEQAGRASLRDGIFGGGVANAVALDGLGLWSHSWFHGVLLRALGAVDCQV